MRTPVLLVLLTALTACGSDPCDDTGGCPQTVFPDVPTDLPPTAVDAPEDRNAPPDVTPFDASAPDAPRDTGPAEDRATMDATDAPPADARDAQAPDAPDVTQDTAADMPPDPPADVRMNCAAREPTCRSHADCATCFPAATGEAWCCNPLSNQCGIMVGRLSCN